MIFNGKNSGDEIFIASMYSSCLTAIPSTQAWDYPGSKSQGFDLRVKDSIARFFGEEASEYGFEGAV